MNSKLVDCVTFFDQNFIFELRYNIINKYIDFFVICESKYDHRGKPKKLNFKFKDNYDENKIKYIVLEEPFPNDKDLWRNQAIQREFILKNLNFAKSEDLIFFSDPDEIPNPVILKKFILEKKYGIFLQKCFNYKFNLFNPHESPWEGTRVCRKKDLKSIDFMRQKVKSKNINYPFWRIDKEKNIQIFENAGWHFNNIMSPELISKKLQTFAHTEFRDEKYSSIKVIKKKIENKIDLFERNHLYIKQDLSSEFPEYLIKNMKVYKDFILD